MKPNDKRYIENMRVKRSIQDGLFALMEKKKFSEIRVSDIISVSGVAKASYYRNFSSLEDIIYSYIDRMNQEIAEQMPRQHDVDMLTMRQNLIVLYNYYLEHRQENTDQFLINALGDMPSKSMERYNIYLLSGAICHVQIEWLKNKVPESPEKFADFNMKFIENNKEIVKKSFKLVGENN